jgi:uncharacterized membrane protein YraQ (UPF0718 family)
LAIAGFAYVKWMPYYAKDFLAQSHHFIGDSILSGNSVSAPPVSWNSAVDYAIAYSKTIWQALLLGLVLGPGIKLLLSTQWMSTALGGLGFKSIALGSLFAIPCMMCTCCAAPVAAGMRQSRASVGSLVSWWIANPVLNPATLVFMGFVLGWEWTLFWVVLGVTMVLGVSYLAEHYGDQHEAVSLEQGLPPEAEALKDSVLTRWGREFIVLAIKLLPEYLILVLLLGATRAWFFPVLGAHDGVFWIVAIAVAGTLFVIPTAGEVPIVQAMFALGMGAGPAGALIMTLPAVSLPSLVMLSRILSLRILLLIAVGVVPSGIAGGLIAMSVF